MKKIFLVFVIFFSLNSLSYSEEYDFMENETIEEETGFQFLKKEKIETENAETITVQSSPIKLNIEKIRFLDSYSEVFNPANARVDLYKTERLTLFSDGKKELSDYMTDNFKSTMNMSYKINEDLVLRAGHEVWYVNPNASIGAKKFYFNPRVNLAKNCYLDYVSKFNQTSKNFEHEVGVNYMPRLFKNSASFGLKASTTIDSDTNEFKSKKLKFSTDFYLF